jgi:hypothetical protein
MTRRFVQVVLVYAVVLRVVSLAAAQQVPQPMVRLGDFIEEGEFDGSYAELCLGVEARYQKNLTLYLLFEHQQIFDGNLIDDRSNSTNPGGTDVFGRAASTENPGFHTERYWIDYKFAGMPFRIRVGADLWNLDQAGLVGDDDPRLAIFANFGDFGVTAAAVIQFESQRLGLENDNDFIYYTFSAGYNLSPHRFQLDVTYFRDRFAGADLSSPRTQGSGIQYHCAIRRSPLPGALLSCQLPSVPQASRASWLSLA